MIKKISILGSTGSIGTQTLEVAEACGFEVVALAANGSNVSQLEAQARKWKPKLIAAEIEAVRKQFVEGC